MTMNFSALLIQDDYEYLSAKYDLPLSEIYRWQDVDWCNYLNCQHEELAFYLLEDDGWVDTQILNDEFDDILIGGDDSDDGDDDSIVSIQDFLDREMRTTPIARTTEGAEYRHPSAFARHVVVKEPPHHFEVVK